MSASHPKISNFIKRSTDTDSTHIRGIIYNSLFMHTTALSHLQSHLQSHFLSNRNHSKLSTPSPGMHCSSLPGGQLICVARLRVRRQRRAFYHSPRLGVIPPNCPSRRPPSLAHPVHPPSVHESHLTLEQGGAPPLHHHTLNSSILCISLAWLSFLHFVIFSSRRIVTVLVEQPINVYRASHLSFAYFRNSFSAFPCTVPSSASHSLYLPQCQCGLKIHRLFSSLKSSMTES